MVTGAQIARARELQIRGRGLGEIAERLKVSTDELDRALWSAAGFQSRNLRTFWADSMFGGPPAYPPPTGPIPA